MKRLLVISIVALAAFGAFAVFRNDVAMALFRRVIAKQVSADLVAEYPEGLHVVSCGSGTPLPDLSMAGGCTAIIAGGRLFVFDVGEGAPETMARMGLRPSRIEAVFLTHFHSDHIAGLGSVALQRNLGDGISAPLRIYGATGVEQVVDGFNSAFAQDHAYRIEHHSSLKIPSEALLLEPREFAPPSDGVFPIVYEKDGVAVRAFGVPHGPVRPAVGYRIDYEGMSVVVSGDTTASENLVAASRGADLLVHEALKPEMVAEIEKAARESGQDALAAVMHDIPSYHATPVDAAQAAARADVKALAFTHMIPPLPRRLLEGPFLEGVGGAYQGPVYVMRDGMILSLRKGSKVKKRKVL